jgi:hypothetical protein
MRNRYGDYYEFKQLSENTYTIVGDLKYWRSGFNNDGSIDFVDPSGGPFISIGYEIDGREVIKIETDEQIIFTVKGK